MDFLELQRDSRVMTGNSGCLLCWPREVQSSIRVAKESWAQSISYMSVMLNNIDSESLGFFLKNFQQFVVIHTVKGFELVNKAKVEVFLELSCFFDDPAVHGPFHETWGNSRGWGEGKREGGGRKA